MKAISVSVNRFLLAAALLLAGLCLLFTSANEALAEALAQACPGADDPPTPTEVAVSAVPIVVESTTADYFVLYASHEVDGETVWYPVKVALGEQGTTTLAENVPALPVERYRVEKYSIADPADVDGDCIGDITEFANAASMNPVNPANDQGLPDRFSIIPDHQAYERLAYVGYSGLGDLKFVIANIGANRPSVFFQNTKRFQYHTLLSELGDAPVRGSIIYDPDLVAPDGSRGMYRYTVEGRASVGLWDRVHTLLAASMPVLDDDLALWVINRKLPQIQAELQSGVTFRANLVFDEDVHGDAGFLALNPGEGYGLLRSLEPDARPNSRDVVIYETLPNELPRVGGIISTVPQTPLSHVNLRTRQDNVPNAFIADALDNADISDLIDSHVYYAVGDTGYTIRAATQAEVDDFYASSRPTEAQTPQRDLTVTSITALGDVRFEDWDSFGVKAANVAVLGTLGFPAGTVPDGFAVPFYFYDEFMKHNGLYDDIEEMLEDPDFQTDYDTKEDELKKLRKKIKKAETPEWIETALTEMHATFPEGSSLRYRSSTNNEDLPGFNGAGLYDSKTQHASETEEDGISKSLKQVYASMWNYRAFTERDFHRIDHLAAAMGVLVHPNYADEPVNGVAVSVDPAYGTEGTHYVNAQRGEDLITNPEAHSEPEEVLLYPDGSYTVVALSNQVPPGELLMTDDQLAQLRQRLAAIHERFADLYAVEEDERFAMEIEFKITSDNVLAIKQARPWVFSDAPRDLGAKGVALTTALEDAPASHDGNLFTFRIRFSDNINIGFQEFEDFALAATGGWVTRANRVRGRSDYWEIDVVPDRSFGDITLVLAHNRHCPVVGAICTSDGQRLSNRLEHTVLGPPPPVPDRPTGRALSSDSVQLEWNHVPRAESYEVQFRHTGQWLDLPANGVEIEFDGDEAVVKRLPTAAAYSFRVRAVNSHGASEWSLPLFMPNRLDLESELTAGRETDISPVRSGYGRFGDLGGTLFPVEFVLDGTTYRVQYLVHSRESLWLGTSPALPADFTLLVGDSVYRGIESMASDTTIADAGYWWPSTTPDWSADGPVRVGLLVHPDAPLGDRQKAPVSGEFHSFPSEHDGKAEFSFRIYFSEGVTTTADALLDHVVSVSGGAVTGVEAIDDEGRIWAVSVTPEGRRAITVGIKADLDCQSSAAICTADGRRLFNRMKLTVNAIKNNPATGPPVIRGVVGLGARLRASLADLDDADGLSGATFRYQWLADGTNIQGATGSFYVVDADNVGKSIRVRVSFTDDEGYKEALTSEPAPAAPNSPATGTPAIIGTAQVGQGLTADTSGITDANGLNNPGYSYQWAWNDGIADRDIVGATGRTYILFPKDEGKTILVRVSFTDDAGNAETRSSAATPTVGHAEDVIVWKTEIASGQKTNVFPLESGYSALGSVGGTLSPDSFEIDGTTYRVRGLVHSSGSLRLGMYRELPADFTLVVGDSVYLGSESMVPPTSDGEEYWWPSATPDWLGDDPVRVGLIVYSGIPLGDRQKAPVTGYFQDYPAEHDGNAEFSFRIYFSEGIATAAGALRDHFLSVSGGTASGVEAVVSDGRIWAVSVTPEGHQAVTVRIEAELDCALPNAVCTSDGRRLFNRMVLTVEPRERNPATGAPTISGTVEPGQTLTADTSSIADADGLTGATFSYQWVSYDGNSNTDIPGATDPTYTPLPVDDGKAFKVRVSFTDDAGFEESLVSALGRSERPYGLNASESDGAVTLTWRVPAGWTGSTFRILRNRPELGETEPLVHIRFTESGMTTYTDTDVEPGVLYVYQVKGVDPFAYSGEASQPFEIRTATSSTPSDTPLSLARGSRPNVVLILADDLGWGDVQTNNPDSAMTTPRIDGIAAAAAYFTDAHTPSSVCTGTRYGLLTGRYSWRSWMTSGVLDGHARPLIGPDRPTLGTLLQGHGYRTAAIGKWHLGMDFARLSDVDEVTALNRGIDFRAEIVDGPLDHGFHEFFGTSANLRDAPAVYIDNRRFVANPETPGHPASGFLPYKEVLDRLTEEAVSFIEREGQTDEPFFLYLPLTSPHVPLAPDEDFAGLTGLGPYADVVAQVDWTVGQVLDALGRVGARDDTLVIFTSDNGSFIAGIPVPNHVDHQPNGMWRGGKGAIHEGGHRVPLLLQWPRGIEAGLTVDATVSLIDMYATLADIVGEAPGPGVAPDGVSLLPLLLGEAETRGTPVVHHSSAGMFALRDGQWKLVFGNGGGLLQARHSRPFERPWELFDMEQDTGELRSVAETRPEIMARMEATLNQLRAAEEVTLSGDATLRSLSLAGINIGPFDPGVQTYSATVANHIKIVEVTAIPTATDAIVTISDGNGSNKRGRRRVRLTDPTTIEVTVTAPDTSAITTYTVRLARPPEAPKGPSIAGTAEVGETLMVDTSVITDPDGLTGATFSYQWVSYDGNAYTDIPGATSTTYTLVQTDESKAFRVRVSFIDDAGNQEKRTSALARSERPYGLNASESDGEVVLTWRVPVGWTGSTFQILRNRPELGEVEPLVLVRFTESGMTTYTDTDVEPGVLYVYRVKGVGPFGYPGEASQPIEIRTAGPTPVENSPATGAPTISGTAQAGETLIVDTSVIADADGLASAAFSYKWLADHSDISGAAGSTYTLTAADVGNTIRVWVSFTDDAGNAESLTSAATAEVEAELPINSPATGSPSITGTAQVGQTLTASVSGIADEDGLTNATFAYQWIRTDGSTDTEIAGATSTTYMPVNSDKSKAVKVQVSFTDDAGHEETLTGMATAAIAPPPLTASFHTDNTPENHDGSADFTFELRFSEEFSLGYVTLRDYSFTINGGAIVNANRVSPPSNLRWRITVQPASDADVSITLAIATNCNDDRAICTSDSRMLSNRLELTVQGPAPESSATTNTPATGVPTVSGTVQVAETLQTSTSGIADDNGLTNVVFAYQWVRVDGTTDTDIGGATGSS